MLDGLQRGELRAALVVSENPQLVLFAPRPGDEGRQLRVPLSFMEQRTKWKGHDLGRMDIRCTGCKALHWTKESSASRRPRGGEPSFQSCCIHGQVQIEPMRPLPEPLNTLMNADNREAEAFRNELQRWNSLFAFTSIWFNMDNWTSEIEGTFHVTCSWVSRDSQREIRRYYEDREEKRRWKSLQEI